MKFLILEATLNGHTETVTIVEKTTEALHRQRGIHLDHWNSLGIREVTCYGGEISETTKLTLSWVAEKVDASLD